MRAAMQDGVGTQTAEALERRVAELEAQLARHVRAEALSSAVDARLEEALRLRQPLERVMPDLLQRVAEHLGARAVAVRTLDESLAERTFSAGDIALRPDELARAAAGESRLERGADGCVLAHRLDVAGEDFGTAFALFDVDPSEEAAALLGRFAEELDNHLAAIALARRKYEVIRAISDALKEPVLDRGIARAIDILHREVGFARLLLLFRHEDDLEAGALRYKVYRDGALDHDSAHPEDPEVDAFVRERAGAFLDGEDAELRARFGITRYREEVLITGVRTARVVGRMLVTSAQGEFHTHDRELLDRFADYLRQRIVDFNREWKQLSNIFSAASCERLLREEGYLERYLTPREKEIAILYGDIAGFTRLSESALHSPEAIGRLIDAWADGVVDIVWDTGGVFDKMVGDCIIGLWGPPFFEMSPEEACRRALDAAARIRAHTRALGDTLPEVRGVPLDVAIGLNWCPVSVGFFGPNDNYTAFSSGMNNTARLQGVASAGEIFCMEGFVAAVGDEARFTAPREATVKNVAEPLVYRELRGAPADP